MRETFALALRSVLVHEGGYVNHPADPGGATNQGIIQRTYDAWRRGRDERIRSVREIEADEVRAIYQAQYWAAVAGDELPVGLDYAVFDFGVNSGPARAARFLQAQLGVVQDGQIGAITLAAAAEADVERVIRNLCAARLQWMRGLSTWEHFGRGWTRRVEGERRGVQSDDIGVVDRAVRLVRVGDAPAPRIPAEGKAFGEVMVINGIAGLQRGLVATGGDPGVVDGVWGPRTEGALSAFFTRHGIAADATPSPLAYAAVQVAANLA